MLSELTLWTIECLGVVVSVWALVLAYVCGAFVVEYSCLCDNLVDIFILEDALGLRVSIFMWW